MEQPPRHKFDVYTELYPASAVAIIGSGLIVVTMGSVPFGAAMVLSGIAVGLAGPVARAVHERRLAHRHRRHNHNH